MEAERLCYALGVSGGRQGRERLVGLRIAVFCPTVSGKGGMEAAIRNLMAGFAELGDDARLFLLGGTYDAGWLEGLRVTQIGSPRSSRLRRMVQYAVGPVWELARWRPDAVICADLTTVAMARFARRMTLHRRMPVASWIHFPVKNVRMPEQLANADLHLAISTEIAEALREKLPAHTARIFTIYNAVSAEQPPLTPRPETAEFLYTGRLMVNDHKRTNDLIAAVARLRGQWRLRVIGAPTQGYEHYEGELRQMAQELGVTDRITWLGWQAKPWELAGAVSALVLPSEREGFPMILLEACSRGIACVASDCAGSVDIVEDGRNGWLYPVGDVDALAARLQRIVDDPAALPTQADVVASVTRFSARATAQRAKTGLLQVIG